MATSQPNDHDGVAHGQRSQSSGGAWLVPWPAGSNAEQTPVEYEETVDVPTSAWGAAGLPARDDGKLAVMEAPPSERDDVPCLWGLLIALPQLSMTSLTLLLNVHLVGQYSRLGASLQIMTLFITIARSTDAITDPAASWLTDSGMLRLCWREGVRRKPFLLIGPWVYDIAMVLLLGTPINFGDNGTMWAVWYGVIQTIFYLGDTLCSIPLAALMPAMSTNHRTRERIFMQARAVNSFGILIAALAPVPLGWFLRQDSCYDAECLACPLALSNATAAGFASDAALTTCQTECRVPCDVEASRVAFRYIGYFFAIWHFVTMYLVVFFVPEPGLEASLFWAKRAKRAAKAAGPKDKSNPSQTLGTATTLVAVHSGPIVGPDDANGTASAPRLGPTSSSITAATPAGIAATGFTGGQHAAGRTSTKSDALDIVDGDEDDLPWWDCGGLSDYCAFRCTQRPSDPQVPATSFRQEPVVAALQKTLRNTAFTSLIPAAVLDMVAFTMIGTSMKLYVDYVVQPLDVPACAEGSRTILGFTSTLFCTSTDVWLGMALCALMLAMIAFIPIWQWLSVNLCGTRRAWLAMNLFGALTTGLFIFGGEGAPLPSVALAFLNGAAQSALYLNDAVLAATIDYDAVINHGERAEARFAMFSSLTPKLASVPAQALPLSILAAIGFREPVRGVLQEQESHVKSYISAIFFVLPTLITLISFFIKLRFPIVHQEQLDRIAHEYRLATGKVQPKWHEKALVRDPLDPSLSSSGTRDRASRCSCCPCCSSSQEATSSSAGIAASHGTGRGGQAAADKDGSASRTSPASTNRLTPVLENGEQASSSGRASRPRQLRRVQSRAVVAPSYEGRSRARSGSHEDDDDDDGGGHSRATGEAAASAVRRRGAARQRDADEQGSTSSVLSSSASGMLGGSKAPRYTIKVYPRVTIKPKDRAAFDVFDMFNVHELGAWRVFGLRFLREKLGRAKWCRWSSMILLAAAAICQVALGLLNQAALSWLPTVTFLASGLTLGLALISHFKHRACYKLNTAVCGGPSSGKFGRWLAANAMALRLNAVELELVDASFTSAIQQHEREDPAALAAHEDGGGGGGGGGAGGRGGWDGRKRKTSVGAAAAATVAVTRSPRPAVSAELPPDTKEASRSSPVGHGPRVEVVRQGRWMTSAASSSAASSSAPRIPTGRASSENPPSLQLREQAEIERFRSYGAVRADDSDGDVIDGLARLPGAASVQSSPRHESSLQETVASRMAVVDDDDDGVRLSNGMQGGGPSLVGWAGASGPTTVGGNARWGQASRRSAGEARASSSTARVSDLAQQGIV